MMPSDALRAHWRKQSRRYGAKSAAGVYLTLPPAFCTEDRFFVKVEEDEHGCWRWLGAVTAGYPQFGVAGRGSKRAHRWAYERWRSPVPAALTLDHVCLFRGCANPWHLEVMTRGENSRLGRVARTPVYPPIPPSEVLVRLQLRRGARLRADLIRRRPAA